MKQAVITIGNLDGEQSSPSLLIPANNLKVSIKQFNIILPQSEKPKPQDSEVSDTMMVNESLAIRLGSTKLMVRSAARMNESNLKPPEKQADRHFVEHCFRKGSKSNRNTAKSNLDEE